MNLLVRLFNCLNKPLPLQSRTASYCQLKFSDYVLGGPFSSLLLKNLHDQVHSPSKMARNLDFKSNTVYIKGAITSRDCVTFGEVNITFLITRFSISGLSDSPMNQKDNFASTVMDCWVWCLKSAQLTYNWKHSFKEEFIKLSFFASSQKHDTDTCQDFLDFCCLFLSSSYF